MTAVHSVSPRDPAQTDLIRYFDGDLVTAGPIRTVDTFAIVARARRDRAALMREMIGGGIAWLWRRATHLRDTRSPPTRLHVESRVQF
ncbi:MAG: hypothetical protein KF889_00855 [Alphaproteobacteria bacterium]|nr:hypothetical protein [Alphaproteobacteria bacterium]MCW5741452.1 hypothetical protein [Alphaproteobacteria bacterium]